MSVVLPIRFQQLRTVEGEVWEKHADEGVRAPMRDPAQAVIRNLVVAILHC
jgi:hypothetical protein